MSDCAGGNGEGTERQVQSGGVAGAVSTGVCDAAIVPGDVAAQGQAPEARLGIAGGSGTARAEQFARTVAVGVFCGSGEASAAGDIGQPGGVRAVHECPAAFVGADVGSW